MARSALTLETEDPFSLSIEEVSALLFGIGFAVIERRLGRLVVSRDRQIS
jgi:hypothetical protein